MLSNYKYLKVLVFVWIVLIPESIDAWEKTKFFVNSKLPQQCGHSRRYNPDYQFEGWGAWPWMGLTQYNGTGAHRCNSILIHPEVAITSLLCWRRVPEFTVRETTFIAFSLPGLPSFQNISVTDIDSLEDGYNRPDIALMKLERPVIISSQVQPICLWEENHNWDQQVGNHIGMMVGSDLNNIQTINELRVYQAPVRIVALAECKKLNDVFFKNKKKQGICFENIREPKNCHYIGSPLMVPRLAEDGTIVWYLRAVTIHTLWFCARDDFYNELFDIGANRQWIESHFKSSVEAGCGRRIVSHTALITQGKETVRGDWPWHAAIYVKGPEGQKTYICGGSLLSPTLILTAAHCTVSRSGIRPADSFIILLGKHSLNETEPDSKEVEASEVIVHFNFNVTYLFNDIALIMLKEKVAYNEYIQPACLWDETETDKNAVANRVGTVVGWGFTEDNKVSNNLKAAVIPIVEDLICYQSNANFYNRFLHSKTFCAGNPIGNRTNVCNGDSGGSFLLPIIQADHKVTWFIRGIVSVAVPKAGLTVCDPDYYAIYTDVAQYKEWIDQFIAIS